MNKKPKYQVKLLLLYNSNQCLTLTLCSEGVEVLKFLNAEEALTGLNPDIGGLLRELILLSAPPGEENIFLPSAVRGPGNILSISIQK